MPSDLIHSKENGQERLLSNLGQKIKYCPYLFMISYTEPEPGQLRTWHQQEVKSVMKFEFLKKSLPNCILNI